MAFKTSFTVPYKKCLVKSGTSVADASSDFSVTQGVYEVASNVGGGEDIYIDNFHFVILASVASSNSSQFGNLATLTNGLTVKYDVDGTNVYTLGTYKSDLELELISDRHVSEEVIGTDHVYEYVLNFDKPFYLKGGRTDRLYVEIDDNLSGLNGVYFSVNGYTSTALITL